MDPKIDPRLKKETTQEKRLKLKALTIPMLRIEEEDEIQDPQLCSLVSLERKEEKIKAATKGCRTRQKH